MTELKTDVAAAADDGTLNQFGGGSDSTTQNKCGGGSKSELKKIVAAASQ